MARRTPPSASIGGRVRGGAAVALIVGATVMGAAAFGSSGAAAQVTPVSESTVVPESTVGSESTVVPESTVGSESTVPVTAVDLPVAGEVLGTIPGTDNDFDTETVERDQESTSSALRPVSIVVGILAALSAFAVGVVIVSRARRPGETNRR